MAYRRVTSSLSKAAVPLTLAFISEPMAEKKFDAKVSGGGKHDSSMSSINSTSSDCSQKIGPQRCLGHEAQGSEKSTLQVQEQVALRVLTIGSGNRGLN